MNAARCVARRRVLTVCLALLLLTTTARALELPRGWEASLPDEVIAAAEEGNVLSGGLAWLSGAVRGSLEKSLRDGTRSAVLLALAALICGAAEGLAEGAGGTAARYVPYCGVLAAAALATGDLRTLLGLGAETVRELTELSKLLLPAMAASMAAGGFVTTASVWQVTTLMACGALGDAVSRFMLPLAYCYVAAAAAGAVLTESRLELLADGMKKLVSGTLTVATAAFSGYLAVAGVLTGSADRTAARVAKAAVSGAIPVVGGILSETAESVLAAAGTLRGTLGALSVFAILTACVAPLLRLGVQFLLYKLAAFAAGLVGSKALGEFLDRLGEAFALVFAMTAACALMLLVAVLVSAAMVLG